MSSTRGSVTMRASAFSPARRAALTPPAAITHGGLASGPIEQASVVELKVMAAIGRHRARQQPLDDVDRLRQALMALDPARPAEADDVLVQAFAGAEAEAEPIVAEQRHGCRPLGDDCRVVAHDRAGDGGHQADLPCRIGDRSQHRPGQRRMALLFDPREKVIGNGRELEPGFLGAPGVAHQVGRAVLLGHELVAEIEHEDVLLCSRVWRVPSWLQRIRLPKVRAG
jgi:hypothetical protein